MEVGQSKPRLDITNSELGFRAIKCTGEIVEKSDGQTSFEPTISKNGDWIKMKANCDLIAVMSACPQDMNPINGVGCSPAEVSFSVEN